MILCACARTPAEHDLRFDGMQENVRVHTLHFTLQNSMLFLQSKAAQQAHRLRCVQRYGYERITRFPPQKGFR